LTHGVVSYRGFLKLEWVIKALSKSGLEVFEMACLRKSEDVGDRVRNTEIQNRLIWQQLRQNKKDGLTRSKKEDSEKLHLKFHPGQISLDEVWKEQPRP